jgi:hypothetical protein
MALILRKDKGQKLTIDDLDGNFEYLESISGGTSSTIDISLTKDVLGGYITDGEKTITEEEIVSTLKIPAGYLEILAYELPRIGFGYTTESEEEIIVRFYQNTTNVLDGNETLFYQWTDVRTEGDSVQRNFDTAFILGYSESSPEWNSFLEFKGDELIYLDNYYQLLNRENFDYSIDQWIIVTLESNGQLVNPIYHAIARPIFLK